MLRIPLAMPSYGEEEIEEAIDSLRSMQVTMGKKVAEFERLWADYVGVKHAVMVNSGSSANLIALATLIELDEMKPGDEVITPALTWGTTIYPIAQVGLIPVIVDIDPTTFSMDVESIDEAISDKTRAIMPVHLLGNPCEMEQIMERAQDNGLLVIEDCCEAHGAAIGTRKVGSFGDVGTYSFYFSHHISTIEGGMVITDRDDVEGMARMLRDHGMNRERDTWGFRSPGYNLRPMETQGAFGIHQVKKLDGFVERRREIAASNSRDLADLPLATHSEREGTTHSFFAYPITTNGATGLKAHLEERGIETRPVMSGNIMDHPVMQRMEHRVIGDLPNASLIAENGFLITCRQGLTDTEREYMMNAIRDFFA